MHFFLCPCFVAIKSRLIACFIAIIIIIILIIIIVKTASRYQPRPAVPDTLFSCFVFPNATAGCTFAAQIISTLYERAICQDEVPANYERAICQEFAKSSPDLLCYACCVLCYYALLTIYSCLLILPASLSCYHLPANFCSALLKLYILLWFLRVLGILTFF